MADGVVEFLLKLIGADEASRALKGAARASGEAAEQAEKGRKRLKEFGQAAGDSESSILALSGVLGLLNPRLGELAMLTGDAAGATEGLVRGLQAGLLPALGTAAAAIGGVWLAWQSYTEEGRRAEEIDKRLAEGQRALKPVLDQTRDLLLDQKVALGELSEVEAASIRARIDAQRSYQDAVAGSVARQKELREAEASWTTSLGDAAEGLREFGANGTGTVLDYVPLVAGARLLSSAWGAMADGVTTSSSEIQEEVSILQVSIEGAAEAVGELADVGADVAERGAGAALAQLAAQLDDITERAAEARRTLARLGEGATGLGEKATGIDLADTRLALQSAMAAGDQEGVAAAAAAAAQLEALAAAAKVADAEIQGAQAAFGAMSRVLAGVPDGLQEAIDGVAASLAGAPEAWQDAIRRGGLAEALLGFVGGDLGGVATGLAQRAAAGSGPLAGAAGAALAAAGQIGAAVAAIQTLGAEGAEGIQATIEAQVELLIEGLIALPELILLRLPEILVRAAAANLRALILELPKAILTAFFQAWLAIRDFVSGLFSRDEAEKTQARQTYNEIVAGVELGAFLGGDFGGAGRQQAARATGQRAARSLGGATIINQGVMTRSIARELARSLQHGRSGYSSGLSLDPVV